MIGNVIQPNGESSGGGADSYSTSEQAIGTWIDGSTLYRKVINISTLPTASNATYTGSGLSSVTIRKIYGIANNSSSSESVPLPFVHESAGIMIQYDSQNRVVCKAYSDRSSMTGYVVLEYTKS